MGLRHKTVLAVSPNRQLGRFRHEVLTQAGFEVITVYSEADAQYEIPFGRCGVLLLCHKLTRAARKTLADEFDRMCHEPYIVAVLAYPGDQYPPQTMSASSTLRTLVRS
jgi:hypothetical protein